MSSLRNTLIALFALLVLFTAGCGPGSASTEEQPTDTPTETGPAPLGITYEIFVQSFYDTDGDSIGDFNGIARKLDYLTKLGADAVWLMPINPSPTYHKYDVLDYTGVHPDYGTMEEFKALVDQAHNQGVKVIMDFVINHTGRDHPWFQAALAEPDGPYRDYYVWADYEDVKDEIEKEATAADSDNIIQWNRVEGDEQLYFAYFWGGMPDLNYDNPRVKEEIFEAARFWLEEVGLDGFRLDAAKHIYPDDRPEDNHAFWREFRDTMDNIKPDVILVGEVWSPAEEVAPYLEGLPALFNFDLGEAIQRSVLAERDDSLVADLIATRDYYNSITDEFTDATFITNHDQNRIMSVVDGDEDKARMAAALLLTLPGSPFLYYGEEIGMQGIKPDEHIREPFLWDRPADDPGVTRWIEPEYTVPGQVTPLDEQRDNPNSLFNFYKKLIDARKSSNVLMQGEIAATDIEQEGILSFYRTLGEERLLVAHNLTGAPMTVVLTGEPAGFGTITFQTEEEVTLGESGLMLPAYSTVILGE